LVIISYTTGLSFAKERIGPLAAIITTVFYLLALYLFALPNTPENLFASIYSETLIKTTCQHLLLLVGFDTLIYRKYYDTPPILVGHQSRECTLDVVQNGVRREGSGHVLERERDARSRRPRRAGDMVRARAAAGPTASQGGWQRLGGVDSGQWALLTRQQWLACRQSLGLHGHAHGRRRQGREGR
jgi:hypothetical protein